jgi:hypothetical protein
VPRVDENDPEASKVAGVARGEGCFAREGDTGDLDIADLDRPADLPLLGNDRSRGLSSSSVTTARGR